MRADHWLVLTAAVCLVVGGAPRPTSQSALTKVRPLVARITPENLHGEWDTGPAVGKEAL